MEDRAFEQGPIRPPSEAGSLLLRFTRNCPWNNCTFCPVYKQATFSRRSLEEIKRDIDSVAAMAEDVRAFSEKRGHGGRVTREVMGALFADPRIGNYCRHIAVWLYSGRGSVFIQDANSLILPSGLLSEAIGYLRQKIPGVRRVTSYARSSTLARKDLSELTRIRLAGLDRIHIGMESGSDRVLEFVNKGVTAQEHIEAGRKVIDAGIELSEYFMPGLGGEAFSREHALESARVLSEIDPHFIRLRSLRIPRAVPLFEDKQSGRFTSISDDDTVREIKLFIESLSGIRSRLESDHAMNLLEEIAGKLPEDKEAMLGLIDRYLGLPPEERLMYRLGRRGGALRSVDELNDPSIRQRLRAALNEIASGGDPEELIKELGDQYI